jgi:hypothetical protein
VIDTLDNEVMELDAAALCVDQVQWSGPTTVAPLAIALLLQGIEELVVGPACVRGVRRMFSGASHTPIDTKGRVREDT